MKEDTTIEKMMAELNEQMEWFHSDEFKLEEAKGRFTRAKQLAEDIEVVLKDMKNDIEVIGKDFSRD